MKKKPQETGIIIQTRNPDSSMEESEDSGDAAMEACAADLIRAIHDKDQKAVASAIKAAIECHSSEPEKDDSIEPHSYEASKE